MVTAGAAVPGGCLVWDGCWSNDLLVLMDAQSKLPRPVFPKAFWICVFVFGKAQKSALGSTFAAFLAVLVALGVHSDTRVRRCGGADPWLLTPAPWMVWKLWTFMCEALLSDLYNGTITVFISLPLLIQTPA